MKTEEETSASTGSPELHPVDDEMIANEDEPEVGVAVPPPPAMPEDIDGNWARPVRQRVRALPKPVTPTREERERHAFTHTPPLHIS